MNDRSLIHGYPPSKQPEAIIKKVQLEVSNILQLEKLPVHLNAVYRPEKSFPVYHAMREIGHLAI
jgi:hypothetical protein